MSKLVGEVEAGEAVRGRTIYFLLTRCPSPSLVPLMTTGALKNSTLSLVKTYVTPWSASCPMDNKFSSNSGTTRPGIEGIEIGGRMGPISDALIEESSAMKMGVGWIGEVCLRLWLEVTIVSVQPVSSL